MANLQIKIKDQIITLAIGVIAIAIVLGAYSAINFYVMRPEQPKIDPQIDPIKIGELKKTEAAAIERYKNSKKIDVYPNGLVTPSTLIEACEDRKKVPEKCNAEIAKIVRVIKSSGEIKEAYLYIKAGVSRNNAPFSPLTPFDSIWFFIDDSEYGGHLLRSRAIINQQTDDGIAELLFDLREVPFIRLPYKDDASPEKVKNILDNRFKIEGNHFVGGFVSSLGIGKVFEMKIGYEGGLLVTLE
jgi:hypothetical protein